MEHTDYPGQLVDYPGQQVDYPGQQVDYPATHLIVISLNQVCLYIFYQVESWGYFSGLSSLHTLILNTFTLARSTGTLVFFVHRTKVAHVTLSFFSLIFYCIN